MCYLVNFKCLGVSWPAFKFCHGLFEARFEAGGETEVRLDFQLNACHFVDGLGDTNSLLTDFRLLGGCEAGNIWPW